MDVTKISLESPRSELCVRGLFGCVPRDLHTQAHLFIVAENFARIFCNKNGCARAGPQGGVSSTNFLNNNPPTAWTFLKMDEILVFKAPKGKWNGRTIAHFSTISTSRNHPFFWLSTDYSRSLLCCVWDTKFFSICDVSLHGGVLNAGKFTVWTPFLCLL